jgi:hypothetical protein
LVTLIKIFGYKTVKLIRSYLASKGQERVNIIYIIYLRM